jgi:hypothetical protein
LRSVVTTMLTAMGPEAKRAEAVRNKLEVGPGPIRLNMFLAAGTIA